MEPQEEKKGWLKTLALLEVGVFEMLFVGGVTALFFIVFNYFNILPISDLYPKYLGFLPHQKESNVSEISTVNKQNTSPTPTPSFNYDTKKAETLLTQYIKDNIKPEFLPTTIEVKQGQQIDGTNGPGYVFDWYYKTSNLTISSNFQFIQNTNTNNNLSIFIQPSNVQETTATVSLAGSLTSLYFTNPFSVLSCQTKGTTSYCESFKTEVNGKRGYGIVFGYEGSKLIHIVFTCFIPNTSKDYTTRQSCISP